MGQGLFEASGSIAKPNRKPYGPLQPLEPNAAVEYDPMDLIHLVQKNFVPLNLMMERAGMSEMDIYERTRDVFLHYKLPYDSEPPEE
jgi:hypothetical protein